MNIKLAILASAIITATCVQAAKQLVDGYTWTYSVSEGVATIIDVEPVRGDVVFPARLGGYPVESIASSMMPDREGFSRIVISEGIKYIGSSALSRLHCPIELPSTLVSIGNGALSWDSIVRWHVKNPVALNGTYVFYGLGVNIEAECDVWGDLLKDGNASLVSQFKCKRQYAANWIKSFGYSKFAGYIDDMPEVEIVSSAMRKDDPTVMDVVYKVHSSAQTVKVRAMAWENGERNLSKAIRPTKWIEGTEANIGDAVTANEEHKLSWRIAGDWATDLSKVKLEVLAVEDDLLPLELQTIPATATHQKMKISWNKMTADHVFDALLWLYADGDAGLTLTNGQLKNGANLLASGTSLYNSETAVGYVFGKMGYQKLAGDELAYARRVTQLELPVSGVQQFAVKYPDAK